LHNIGAEAVDLLIQKFSLFGVEGQVWMIVVVFLIAFFIFLAWRGRSSH
jgi:hypothetical protein